MITKSYLLGLKRRALRKRLWYKALDSLDRGFYNLTCMVVDKVESSKLIREVLGVLLKLREALKGEFVRLVESLGVERAWEASVNAVSWGYISAKLWRWDDGFARFHAMLEYNSPSGWGV